MSSLLDNRFVAVKNLKDKQGENVRASWLRRQDLAFYRAFRNNHIDILQKVQE
jgi:hypothetical protein